MSNRSRAASLLAEHLSTIGTPVAINWDNPSGRATAGFWCVEWVDGPTITTMRILVASHARWIRRLDITTLRYARRYTPAAWAAALLAMAERGDLPDTAREAVALVEYDLDDTEAIAWAATWSRAVDLARRCDDNPWQMAAMLIAWRQESRSLTIP